MKSHILCSSLYFDGSLKEEQIRTWTRWTTSSVLSLRSFSLYTWHTLARAHISFSVPPNQRFSEKWVRGFKMVENPCCRL